MSRNSFIYPARSFNYTFASKGHKGPPLKISCPPPLRLLFLTPTRSNRIIDGIKRRSVWVSFKQRPVGARARSWGIVTGLGRWSPSSKTSSRHTSRLRDPASVSRCTVQHRHATASVCAYAPGWFAGRWGAPQLYRATSYYDNTARETPKSRKGRSVFSHILRRPANFLLARDGNILDGWWSRRYLCTLSKKIVALLINTLKNRKKRRIHT